jgi:hypothetical protein
VGEGQIAVDDPRSDDVRTLLERHLEFASEHSPPEDVHALRVEACTLPEAYLAPRSPPSSQAEHHRPSITGRASQGEHQRPSRRTMPRTTR